MKRPTKIGRTAPIPETVDGSARTDTPRLTPAAKDEVEKLLAQWAAETLLAERRRANGGSDVRG